MKNNKGFSQIISVCIVLAVVVIGFFALQNIKNKGNQPGQAIVPITQDTKITTKQPITADSPFYKNMLSSMSMQARAIFLKLQNSQPLSREEISIIKKELSIMFPGGDVGNPPPAIPEGGGCVSLAECHDANGELSYWSMYCEDEDGNGYNMWGGNGNSSVDCLASPAFFNNSTAN